MNILRNVHVGFAHSRVHVLSACIFISRMYLYPKAKPICVHAGYICIYVLAMSVRLLVFEPLIISQLTHRGIHLLQSSFTFSYMLRGALFSAYLLHFSLVTQFLLHFCICTEE